MMKIERSNYETWFIDWLDGNLNDQEAEQLLKFLDENPDLKEELGDIESFRLKPSEIQITDKHRLKKSVADLSDSQYEYLCVAFLENELSTGQRDELLQLAANNPVKKKTFELISKSRLSPAGIIYPHKKLLLRRTVFQSAVRISAIVLSAAAVVIFAFMIFFRKTPDLPFKQEIIARAFVIDSGQKIYSDQNISEEQQVIFPGQQKNTPVKRSEHTALRKSAATSIQSHEKEIISDDTDSTRTAVIITKVSFLPDVSFRPELPDNLIALNYSFTPEPYDEERSKFGKFFAKTFREKLLKEKTPKDSPLKVYEIAQAGVAGLNKLLGWEMALDERKDQEGNLRSVYFSSKMLKFNAPVKKNEALR